MELMCLFVYLVTFEQGISEFCKWVNTQEVKEDKYEASIAEMKAKGLYK